MRSASFDYYIDDPRKVARRERRRELVTDRRQRIRQGQKLLKAKIRRLGRELSPGIHEPELLDEIGFVLGTIRGLETDLLLYRPEPRKAPRECRCRAARRLELPRQLTQQLIDVSI